MDDPLWTQEHQGGFDWGTYFAYAMKPRTYGTFCNLAAFVRMSGIPVEVYSWRKGLELVWSENNDGAAGGCPIALLRGNVHFDLLALKEPGTSLPIAPGPKAKAKAKAKAKTKAKAKAKAKAAGIRKASLKRS